MMESFEEIEVAILLKTEQAIEEYFQSKGQEIKNVKVSQVYYSPTEYTKNDLGTFVRILHTDLGMQPTGKMWARIDFANNTIESFPFNIDEDIKYVRWFFNDDPKDQSYKAIRTDELIKTLLKLAYCCVNCNEPMPWWDPKMCCSGAQCGCMGMPTEPQICSEECYEIAYGHTWFHGSPILFKKFEIGKPSNSQVPFNDSIALTKNIDLARVFAKNGYLYKVKFEKHQDTPSKEYSMPILNDDTRGSRCLRVYDASELTILSTEKI